MKPARWDVIETLLSSTLPKAATQVCDQQEITSTLLSQITQIQPIPQTSRAEAFALELRAIRVSYLLLGALKSLAVILGSGKFTDVLQAPKADSPTRPTSPFLSPNLNQATGGDGGAELRSVLQYVVRSMVKWAVRPCPIKQCVALADLERAQVMIYKGALSKLHETKRSKERKGTVDRFWILNVDSRFLFVNHIRPGMPIREV